MSFTPFQPFRGFGGGAVALPPENMAHIFQLGDGNQNFSGALGYDITIIQPITVCSIAVFDSDQNGLQLPITASIYLLSDQSLLRQHVFGIGSGELVGAARKATIEPLHLLPGQNIRVVAWGYGDFELNGNGGGGFGSTYNGGKIICEYGGYFNTSQEYPTSYDGGPPPRYGAATIGFW